MSDPQDPKTPQGLPEELPGTEPPTEQGRANVPPPKKPRVFPEGYRTERYADDLEFSAFESTLGEHLEAEAKRRGIEVKNPLLLAQLMGYNTVLAHPYGIAAEAFKALMSHPGQRAIVHSGATWPTELCYKMALKAAAVLCRLGLDVRVVVGENRSGDIFLGFELMDVPKLPPEAFRAALGIEQDGDDPDPKPTKHPVKLMLYDDELPDYLAEVAREHRVWRPSKV